MKVLLINKFLYPNGGSETYVFKLGDYLLSQGIVVTVFFDYFHYSCSSSITGLEITV